MPDRIVPMSPGTLLDLMVPPQMVEDLLAVCDIPAKAIDGLSSALMSESGFLVRERLSQLVREVVGEERLSSAATRILENLSPDSLDPLLGGLREWRDAGAKSAARLPEEKLSVLEGALRTLIQRYPALERYRKSRRLAAVTGNIARGLEIICDVRPVFNENRDRIEGAVPLTILKLVYDGQDDETRVVEVLLSRDLLDQLVNKARNAHQKLNVIAESIDEWIPGGSVTSA